MTFDERARALRRSGAIWSIGCLAPFLALALFGAGFWLLEALEVGWGWLEIIAFTVMLACSALFTRLLRSRLRADAQPRIVPYFERSVGLDVDCWASGAALARHHPTLLGLAWGAGLRPLDDFRANDRWCGEPEAWHDPAEMATAVRGLRALLHAEHPIGPDRGALLEELDRLIEALYQAATLNIGVCLHLRPGGTAVSPMEMDRLSGSYW